MTSELHTQSGEAPADLPAGANLDLQGAARREAVRLSRGERKLVALGIEPALVDEDMAAAACGMSVGRFRVVCPLAGLKMGPKRLWPLDEVRRWARRYWAEETGSALHDDIKMGSPLAEEEWASRLPGERRGKRQVKGPDRANSH